MDNGLTFAASLRCADCRDGDVPLDPRLVAQWQAGGADAVRRLVADR